MVDEQTKRTIDNATYSKNFHLGGAGGLGGGANSLDEQMAANDAKSGEYVNKLQGIYDGYAKYAADFGAKAQPIMDALNGNIKEMEGYVADYGQTLSDIKPTMMDGINVDPSATRTREEYQGNVASAYGKAREQQAQNMTGQGLNPYANKGGDRQMNLAEAAAKTSAGNNAYKDWRTQYNQDVQAKQAGQATFAGLQAKRGDMQGNIMSARGGLLDANAKIMNSQIAAGQAQASGIENLASVNEARRAENLGLAQQKQANSRTDQSIVAQQLSKELPNYEMVTGSFKPQLVDNSQRNLKKIMET
ncbi:MAG: hypothetical protein Q8L15_18535 [Methylobacter sp.]|nr:hypothetical protein [Methylobacter sp.]